MALVDKVAKRVIDGNQKDEEESRSPCAVDNAEHQIGESDKCGEGKLVPRTTDLGVEMLAMMVELVVCFLLAGKRLAVDGDGAIVAVLCLIISLRVISAIHRSSFHVVTVIE